MSWGQEKLTDLRRLYRRYSSLLTTDSMQCYTIRQSSL